MPNAAPRHRRVNRAEHGQGLVSYALILLLVLGIIACGVIFLLSRGVIQPLHLAFAIAVIAGAVIIARIAGRQLWVMVVLALTALHLFDPAKKAHTINLRSIVWKTTNRFRPVLQRRDIILHIAPELPRVRGFPLFVEEIFDHMTANAIKYFGDSQLNPRITITAERVGDEVICRVADNGVGIAPEYLESVFNWFFRVRHPGTYGFGIGLPLVRFMVTRMKGRCGVESIPGQGSTFWFTLPADPAQK